MPEQLGGAVNSVKWCDCEFLAAGAYLFNGNNGAIAVYQLDQTMGTLSQIGTTTTLGSHVFSVAWCPTCSYLAAGGNDSEFKGIIQVYSFDPSNPHQIEPVGDQMLLGAEILSVDWCSGCSFLAAAGDDNINGIVQIYSFDGVNLTPTGDTFIAPTDKIRSIKWCGDCHYLVAGGDEYLAILGFDPANPENGLTEEFSLTPDKIYRAVDWCQGCSYLAAVGTDNVTQLGFIEIYAFDPSVTSSLTTVTSIINVETFVNFL